MKRLLLLLAVSAGCIWAQPTQICQNLPWPNPFPVQNDTTTGTTLFYMADLTSAGNAINSLTSSTAGAIGIVVNGAGTKGSACVAYVGPVSLYMDNTSTAGHCVIRSTTTAGEGHDTGSACTAPPAGDWWGEVIVASSGANGLSVVMLHSGLQPPGVVSVNGQTGVANANSGATAHTVAVNEGNGSTIAGAGPGTAGQLLSSQGSSTDPHYLDGVDVKLIPAANCNAATAGAGWSTASSNFTPACRAGTNNLGGALQAIPNTGAAAQFLAELPQDWDTSTQPYISIFYGSGSNASGTVIWTVSSACSKENGSVSDDPSFNAESAFATQTMAAANRMWAQNGQFTAITSGNNCIAGSSILIKVAVSGTASSNINAYQVVLTIPRLPVVQAN